MRCTLAHPFQPALLVDTVTDHAWWPVQAQCAQFAGSVAQLLRSRLDGLGKGASQETPAESALLVEQALCIGTSLVYSLAPPSCPDHSTICCTLHACADMCAQVDCSSKGGAAVRHERAARRFHLRQPALLQAVRQLGWQGRRAHWHLWLGHPQPGQTVQGSCRGLFTVLVLLP